MASDVMDTSDPNHNYPHEAAHRRSASNFSNASASPKQSMSPYHRPPPPPPPPPRLSQINPRSSDTLAPQRNAQQLRRHRSYTTLPIDSLVRKLSKQSLRHHESHTSIRRRPSSIDLHRSPALRSEFFSNFSTASDQRHGVLSDEKQARSSQPSAVSQSFLSATTLLPGESLDLPPRPQSTFMTLRGVESPAILDPTLHWRAVPVTEEKTGSHTQGAPSYADEGYGEGDDDLTWLDNDDAATLGLAGHLRRRGQLRYRSSQEAAMQCSTRLVRNEPRMRRRRKQKERRLSTATNASQASDFLSSSTSQLPRLTGPVPQTTGLLNEHHV